MGFALIPLAYSHRTATLKLVFSPLGLLPFSQLDMFCLRQFEALALILFIGTLHAGAKPLM